MRKNYILRGISTILAMLFFVYTVFLLWQKHKKKLLETNWN